MDELAKAMKVIRLKDEEYGHYLTASQDAASITLSSPDSDGWKPKNSEWRLQWLKEPKGLVGQVCLWSIYDKVLTVDGDPGDHCYYDRPKPSVVSQKAWQSVARTSTAAEWKFELRGKKDNKSLVGHLLNRSESFGVSFALIARISNTGQKHYKLDFDFYYRKSYLRWFNINSWKVEVVAIPWEMRKDHPPKHDDTPSKKSIIPKENELVLSAQGAIKDDCKNNKAPAIVPQSERQVSDKRKGETFCDQFMSTLPGWQVGQVYLNLAPFPAGFRGSSDYSYYSSGGNVNGSGVQKNGAVTVSSEFGRSRENNANFVNY